MLTTIYYTLTILYFSILGITWNKGDLLNGTVKVIMLTVALGCIYQGALQYYIYAGNQEYVDKLIPMRLIDPKHLIWTTLVISALFTFIWKSTNWLNNLIKVLSFFVLIASVLSVVLI